MAHDTNIPPGLPPVTYAPRPPRLHRPPFWMIAIGLVGVVASWLPLVLFARARVIPSKEPRVSFVQDMGSQPKFKEQQSNSLFADGRADRLPVPGTVARGKLEEDDHYYRGYSAVGHEKVSPVWFEEFPKQAPLTEELIHRGQNRFNIYCSVCHGFDGRGHGTVNERSMQLMSLDPDATKWTQVADLTSGPVRAKPVGSIYNTINVGIRNMAGYGAQVPVEDRWAIVAYVRALQAAQPAAPTPPPAEKAQAAIEK